MRRVRVSADGVGVVSHAGVGMLREVADLTGLVGNVTEVLADTYQGPWVHEPGRVFADLAVAVADGAEQHLTKPLNVNDVLSLLDLHARRPKAPHGC